MTLPRKWRIINLDKNKVKEIQKQHNLSIQFSKVLVDRGIETEKEIEKLLNPCIEFLHQPALLPDIEIGTERICKAIKNREKILIWGDEDTDGITATVFLFEILRNLNADVLYHIPSRKKEGIGLNLPGIEKAYELGCTLIITVDCASTDFNQIMEARRKGIDVVVTDHHEIAMDREPFFPLINPKRKDSTYPFRNIAGVTVAFKLGWHVTKELLSINNGEWESIISEWLPLVFLGTYADRVPLKDENWILSKLGFIELQKTKRKGIRVLTEMLCVKNKCDEGNVQKMVSIFSTGKTKGWGENVSFQILTEVSDDYLYKTIAQLIKQSEEWHILANESFRRIISTIDENTVDKIIFVYEPETTFNYIGYCTSRLKERFHRPVVAVADKGNYLTGEARAPQGFNIHEILSKQKNLFLSFGGHKPACGFTMKKENLNSLRKFLAEECTKIPSGDEKKREMKIIDILPLEMLTEKIKNEITLLSPFGSDNPPPLFLARGVPLTKGVYTYLVPETGQSRRIEMKSNTQTWVGIDGKAVKLDIIYYVNSAGVITIADARPSLFNEPI
ncbi:DHH family phosphoesterase [candidate division WOR-3 bacterium]|nr:DHH family phosphoesterase [candidate division WOR-3 bacterium]